MPQTSDQGSAFDPRQQAGDPTTKIIVALERISQAFRVLLWQQAGPEGLSPIQLQILLFICFHAPGYCTVSYLAREFGLSRATVSDSVKMLATKGLVSRQTQPDDGRSHVLALTETGRELAERLAGFAGPLTKPINNLSVPQQETLLESLLLVVRQLSTMGILHPLRMCFSCRFHSQENGRYYCRLLGVEQSPAHLRLDCPEHQESNQPGC